MEHSPEDEEKIEAIKRKAAIDAIKRKAARDREENQEEPLSMDDIGEPIGRRKSVDSSRSNRRRVPWFLKAVAILVGAFLVAAFARFGTVSPCGMLERDLRQQLTQKMLSDAGSGSGLEQAGRVLGLTMGGALLDTFIKGLTPTQCTKALWRMYVQGEKPFDELTSYRRSSGGITSGSGLGGSSSTRLGGDAVYPKGWTLSKGTSAMDDSPSAYIYSYSTNSIRDWLDSEKRPTIYLRCKENKTDAFINLDATPDYDFGDYGAKSAKLRLRYDSEPAQTVAFSLATSNDAVFFPSAITTIKKMMQHDKLVIEVTLHNMGSQLLTFDLKGLDAVVPELRKACNW